MKNAPSITVTTTVAKPIEAVWKYWTQPEHIMHWNNASPDWHTPQAAVDLKEGGSFTSRMEAKDGSAGFDFTGTFTKIIPHSLLEYIIEDGRVVRIEFTQGNNETTITETFAAEDINSIELQKSGWQAILDNFKHYAEAQ